MLLHQSGERCVRERAGVLKRGEGFNDLYFSVAQLPADDAKAHLGVSPADMKKLRGRIDHLFHLAAIYDLKAGAEEQQIANVDGTTLTILPTADIAQLLETIVEQELVHFLSC